MTAFDNIKNLTLKGTKLAILFYIVIVAIFAVLSFSVSWLSIQIDNCIIPTCIAFIAIVVAMCSFWDYRINNILHKSKCYEESDNSNTRLVSFHLMKWVRSISITVVIVSGVLSLLSMIGPSVCMHLGGHLGLCLVYKQIEATLFLSLIVYLCFFCAVFLESSLEDTIRNNFKKVIVFHDTLPIVKELLYSVEKLIIQDTGAGSINSQMKELLSKQLFNRDDITKYKKVKCFIRRVEREGYNDNIEVIKQYLIELNDKLNESS